MKRLSYNTCTGICLLQVGRLTIEYWRVPQGGEIPKHTHPNIVSRFVFFDRNLFAIRSGSIKNRPIPLFRWYTVPAGAYHYAHAVWGPARFLNFEWWIGEGSPKSAAEDFSES